MKLRGTHGILFIGLPDHDKSILPVIITLERTVEIASGLFVSSLMTDRVSEGFFKASSRI